MARHGFHRVGPAPLGTPGEAALHGMGSTAPGIAGVVLGLLLDRMPA